MGTHPIFESDFDCLTEATRTARLQSFDWDEIIMDVENQGAADVQAPTWMLWAARIGGILAAFLWIFAGMWTLCAIHGKTSGENASVQVLATDDILCIIRLFDILLLYCLSHCQCCRFPANYARRLHLRIHCFQTQANDWRFSVSDHSTNLCHQLLKLKPNKNMP